MKPASDESSHESTPQNLLSWTPKQGQPAERIVSRTHAELDLCSQAVVNVVLKKNRSGLHVSSQGGLHSCQQHLLAEFIYDYLMVVKANVIHSGFQNTITYLLFLGSSCFYPRMLQQPMREDALLTGTLEPTNEHYAIAKIVGIKLCESYNRQYGTTHGVDYRIVMSANLQFGDKAMQAVEGADALIIVIEMKAYR